MDIDDELVLELARVGLLEISPAEVPQLDALGPELLAASKRHGKASDGSLGFGIPTELLAPVAVAVAHLVVGYLAKVGEDYAVTSGEGFVKTVLDNVRRKRRPTPPPTTGAPAPVSLGEAQLDHVQKTALDQAKQLGLPEDKAKFLSNAICGALRIG